MGEYELEQEIILRLKDLNKKEKKLKEDFEKRDKKLREKYEYAVKNSNKLDVIMAMQELNRNSEMYLTEFRCGRELYMSLTQLLEGLMYE